MTREGDQLHHSNTKVTGCTLEKCWQECLTRSNFEQKQKNVLDFNAKNKRKKRGLSLTPIKFAPSFFCGFLNQV
jgi:xanthine dehydrogenase molybdopterin-binding subunit B